MSWRPLLVAAVCVPGLAFADGGALRLTRAAGPFVVSIFTAPEPLRVGSADVSVLVQRRDSTAVVLDASVELRVRAPDAATRMLAASHALATNRLMQAAPLELPAAGRWELDVTVGQGSDVATVSCELFVEPPAPRLFARWPPLALPPLAVALFIWRDRLLRRRARR
jgi:hypothetical protein